MDFVVRRAEAEDVDVFTAALAEGAAFMRRRGEGRWPAESITRERVATWIGSGEGVVALSDRQLAGVMLLQWQDLEFWLDHDDAAAGYLHKIAVRRAFAGAGVVNALVAWAAEETLRRGRFFLRLDTGPWPKLIAVYTRVGFVEVDQIRNGASHIIRFARRLA